MIKLLDKTTIDKIAAGEVIERPSSVVKELLENSIDAGATSITVEIKEGGLSFIRVTDNGCGIPRDEVKTAYMRHATSKIDSADDLCSIGSLGFRGEALSTIAAVSQAEMITKTAEALTGVKYVIHGGMEIEFAEVGVPDGTTIVVRNLFFNTPARKKFLKTPMTEGSYINDLVLKIALSHPEISFKLISNGQTKLDTAGNGNIKDTVYQLFGRDITSNLIEINYKDEHISISGFIGKPFISRGNRGLENYYINNRYIKSSIINRAIEEGYRTFVMQHKFPFTVMYIELPTDKCDVNVHPTKMEFKYDNEKLLFEVISRAVRDALSHKELIPKAEYNSRSEKTPAGYSDKTVHKPAEPFETKRQSEANVHKNVTINESISEKKTSSEDVTIRRTPQANVRAGKYSPTYKILESLRQAEEKNAAVDNIIKDNGADYTPSGKGIAQNTSDDTTAKIADKSTDKNAHAAVSNPAVNAYRQAEQAAKAIKKEPSVQNNEYNQQTTMFDNNFLSETARTKHRLIGQLFDTYWLIEYDKNLYIMDQHAAHEKIKYEELIDNLKNKEVFSQQLMPPMVVTVSYAERQSILENFDLFMKIGYDIEEFGGNEFKINAVPANLYGIHGREMFMEFVASLINNSGYMSNDVFIKKLSTMACKAAIKGNMHISFQEADALIDQLLRLDNPYTCPHGRPTIISISETELEKKFKRIL